MKPNSGRKQAQRKILLKDRCEMCGGTKILQRHHKDGDCRNNSTDNVMTLCQNCHTKVHMLNDTWGRGRVPTATCTICKEVFQPSRRRRSVLCGKPECLRENGRRAAAKRWSHA